MTDPHDLSPRHVSEQQRPDAQSLGYRDSSWESSDVARREAASWPYPQRRLSRRRWLVRGVMLVTVATLIGVAVWPRSRPTSQHGAAAASYWNLELSSAGTKPVTALVFGDEAGVHLVQLPGSGASAEERQRVPVRLGSGDVYMMSMGWSGLDVRTSSPAGSAPMSFGAQARFVKLFKSANGTGIQTSWR